VLTPRRPAQHSAITDPERRSCENFYGNLVWVIDGRGFRDNFDIYHLLPAPTPKSHRTWSGDPTMQGAARGIFFRLSESQAEFPDENITKATLRGGF